MMKKIILYQSDPYLALYEFHLATLTLIDTFTSENSDIFSQYFEFNKNIPTYWLLDSAKEEHRLTTMPHVGLRDRQESISFRIKQLFDNTDYICHHIQGREEKGRRDDRILFSAINNPEILQPWLNLLLQYKVPLVGIYSATLLSEKLLALLPKNQYILLISKTWELSNGTVGIRENFFYNGFLQFSRLINLELKQGNSYSEALRAEIIRLQDYLTSSRILNNLELLSIVIIAENDYLDEFAASLQQQELLTGQIHLVDTYSVMQSFKITDCPTPYLFHHLLIFLIARYSIQNHYAKPIDRRYQFHRNLRKGLYISTGLVVITTLLINSFLLYEAIGIQEDGQVIAHKVTQKRIDIDEIRRNLPVLPDYLSLEEIRHIVDVGTNLQTWQQKPFKMWKKISEIIINYPNITIERLMWSVSMSDASETVQTMIIEKIILEGRINLEGRYVEIIRQFSQLSQSFNLLGKGWSTRTIQSPYANPRAILQQDETKSVDVERFILEIQFEYAVANE